MAQDTTPPAPAAEPAPVAVPAQDSAANPPEAQPAAPAEEPGSDITGWFRIDSDWGFLQLWAGAAHPLSEGLSLATDIYVTGNLGEFDIGPAITLGPAVITPMLGLQIDWTKQKAAALVPQFYTIVDGGPVYFESWIQVYLYDVFDKSTLSFLHTRDFVLFKASDVVSIGVEGDLNLALSNKGTATYPADAHGKTVWWLPIGPHLKLKYGKTSTLELFAGYDVVAKDQGKDKLAGRFTFVQTW